VNSTRKTARLLQHEIGRTLLTRWDPIGIRDEPAAADEYDSYVGGVYRLLASGASALQIAEHLAGLEARMLGYPDTDPKMLVPVANELRKVYARHRSTDEQRPVR
jgi:hypothetical protein